MAGMLNRISKMVVVAVCALILFFLIADTNHGQENAYLLFVLTTLFLGLIPIIVAAITAKTYVQNGIGRALLMSCGMLVFGLGSILSVIVRFLPDSTNYTVAIHNMSAFLGSILNLLAATIEPPHKVAHVSRLRKCKLALSFIATGVFVIAIATASVTGNIPLFFGPQGSTEIRNIILWMTIAFYFGSSVAFFKQFHHAKSSYLYWYSLAFLMLAIGMFAVSVQKAVGSPLGWAGRASQYIGCLFALLSIMDVRKSARESKVSASEMMEDFFIDAETKYRNLVESISSAIVNVDEDFSIFHFNTAARELFKYEKHDILNASFLESMILEPYRERLRRDVEKLKAAGGSALMGKLIQLEAKDKEGRTFPIELSLSIHKLTDTYASTYIIQDITERKQQEEMLRHQAEELKKKNRLITDFFTNVSHEFKTPLTIILNAIEMTEMKCANAEFENKKRVLKNLAIMRQNAHRLLRLVANLLDVSKMDAGFLQINLQDTDVSRWMGKLVDSVVDYAALREIEVTLIDDMQIQSMPMDGEKLDRILLNLLSNSIKHTGKGGHITVTLSDTTDNIRIAVTDDDEGIPDDKKDLIFDRFRQVNTSMTRASEGSGIGLALTKSLVELLNGRIWFESRFGEGTTFFVELPVVQSIEKSPMPVMDGLTLNRKVQMEFSDII